MQQQVYAAQCNDDNLRFASSSGGIFTLLAETVLRRGGVVFGAAITENIEVQHIAVETPEDLSAADWVTATNKQKNTWTPAELCCSPARPAR